MALSKEDGFKIREEYSTIKEKMVCDKHNLVQLGGSKTKIDGFSNEKNVSIKNASGVSTQVHLTTQKSFIESFDMNSNCVEFIKLFCGNETMNNYGRDRYQINQIDSKLVDSFKVFLDENKERIIDLIVRNGHNITHIIFNDIKKNNEYELTYQEIINRISKCEWIFMNGGIHLKDENKKTYFHFQREGKRSKTNRYNVLWHIHKNLFV
jgi:hypothetical protein